MTPVIEDLYAALQPLLPGVLGLAILDRNGSVTAAAGAPLDEKVPASLSGQLGPDNPGPVTLPGPDGSQCRALWQVDPVRDEPLIAVLRYRADSAATAALDHLLGFALQTWCRDTNLNAELDSMAEELAARYEELNLAYGSEDKINQYEEGQAALRSLVRDSADYLAANLALLHIPRKKLCVYKRLDPNHGPDLNRLTTLTEERLVPFLFERRDSITVNHADDSLRADALPDIAEKFVACPLYTQQGTVEGALVVFADAGGQDFTNSDRNLLEVMARKAGKIIAANYDGLTGLFNRQALEYFLDLALRSARDKRITHCLLHLDLNRMRIINDTISHQRGDEVIQEAAQLLQDQIRESDIIARLEGAQFSILLENCPVERGEQIAYKLNETLSQINIEDRGNRFSMSASIGMLTVDHATENASAAIRSAEIASVAAKESGDGTVQVYSRDDHELTRRHEQMRWVAGLQTALRENRFELYCQRIEPLQQDGAPLHYEILMRLHDAEGRFVSPAEFIPAAERYQLMPAIDRWVVRHTLQALDAVHEQLAGLGVTWAINLSGQSLITADFLPFLLRTVQECRLAPRLVGFEITETVAIDDMSGAVRFINTIREQGHSFSLDDFGTGLSSFTYLKALPLDYLKIDGSFVKEILTDPIANVMVDSINDVGQAMGLRTIAEYVETAEICEALRAMGITYAQGYHIAKPRPLAEELADLLAGKILPIS